VEKVAGIARMYREGDEMSILKLFESVFETRTMNHWIWKFRDNPYGKPITYLIEEDGKIVGHYSGVPYHLNFLGKEIPAAQGIDAMVHENYQGKGFFTILAANVYGFCKDNGFKIVFGCPNQNTFPIVMRKFWENIGNLKAYYRQIGFKKLLRISWLDWAVKMFIKIINLIPYYFLMWKIGGMHIETLEQVPDQIDTIWNKCKSNEVLSVWKDTRYLKWRYDSHPDFKYSYHVIYKNGTASGYVISRVNADSVMICEIVHVSKNVDECRCIIRYLVDLYVMKHYQKISFLGLDSGFFESVLCGCGFISKFSLFPFGGVAFGESKLNSMFPHPQNWSVSWGDTDII
jgi:GNAT superfamily N-acetyltransferase